MRIFFIGGADMSFGEFFADDDVDYVGISVRIKMNRGTREVSAECVSAVDSLLARDKTSGFWKWLAIPIGSFCNRDAEGA